MGVIRLKPTRYSATYPNVGVVQNPESVINGLNPEDASSANTYAAVRSGRDGSYGPITQNDIHMYFNIPNNISIKKITVKARMATYNNGSKGGYIEIPLGSNATGKLVGQCYEWSNPAYAQNYMAGGTSNYSQYEVGESYLPYFIERVTNHGLYFYSGEAISGTTYISGVVLDIEYEEPNDLKIGVNKLKKAILNNTLIKKIYKGSNLLFKYSRLPDNFKELEYIQSQWYPLTYIDTGVAWNASTKIEAEFITRSTGSNGTKLFVATQGDSSMPGFTYLYIDTSNQVIGSNVSVSTYVVGTDSVEATYTSSTTSNIYLTAWSDVYWACTFRYKNIKIYNGNTLLRNYIPCYRVLDGIAGLYDLVNNVFYASDGSSNYLKGPETEIELPTAYQKVEYIEGSGDIYIDTNYVCQNDSTFYFDYKDEQVHSEVVYANYFYTPYYRLIRFPDHTNTVLEIRNTTATDSVDVPSTLYNTRNKVEFLIDKVLDASSNVLVTYPHTSKKLGVDSHLILFRGYYYNSWDSYGYYKLYGFKVFEGNGSTLVKNYVPCYRKSDNVIGLYETVQGQFITGTGTGSFTKGPNIV